MKLTKSELEVLLNRLGSTKDPVIIGANQAIIRNTDEITEIIVTPSKVIISGCYVEPTNGGFTTPFKKEISEEEIIALGVRFETDGNKRIIKA